MGRATGRGMTPLRTWMKSQCHGMVALAGMPRMASRLCRAAWAHASNCRPATRRREPQTAALSVGPPAVAFC
eukprot:365083-Chlamydomonas_euryale.AAC.27